MKLVDIYTERLSKYIPYQYYPVKDVCVHLTKVDTPILWSFIDKDDIFHCVYTLSETAQNSLYKAYMLTPFSSALDGLMRDKEPLYAFLEHGRDKHFITYDAHDNSLVTYPLDKFELHNLPGDNTFAYSYKKKD